MRLRYHLAMFQALMQGDVPAHIKLIAILVLIWKLIWKGLGLWRAGKFEQKNWFIAILLLDTFGIIEIVYLFKYAKKPLKLQELMFWKKT